MWLDTPALKDDLRQICDAEYIPWEALRGKTVLITGATGLIGSTLLNALLYVSREKSLGLHVAALVRDKEKVTRQFQAQIQEKEDLQFIEGTMEALPKIICPVDYIIHGANPTSSAFFVSNPVETAVLTVSGTVRLLELAREKQTQSFVYLSSMEVYGAPQADDPIDELHGTDLNTMSPRSSYPEAKRLCENLCAGYCSEYAVPTKVVRLAQTFGPGVSASDERVFAYFARCAMQEENIVLKTSGASKRTYLYTMDAAAAILTVLLCGQDGAAYNAANPATYCSVYEMAQMVARKFGEGKMGVVVSGEGDTKYAPVHCLNLCIDRIRRLGWQPKTDLPVMYRRMIYSMQYAQE